MSSIRYVLTPEHKGKENLWKVDIILHHHYERRTIPTNIYATTKDIRPDRQLRGKVLRDTTDLCRLYRQRLEHLQLREYELDIDTIYKLITAGSEVDIDFLAFAGHWLEHNSDKKGIGTYKMAVSSFRKFVRKESFPCSKMSVQLLKEFERSLSDRPCSADKYPRVIKRIFNDIREIYNDNDTASLFVKRSLDHWEADQPYFPAKEQLALSIDQIRAIAAVPDEKRVNSRRNLARDAFLISFMMMGTNAIDLMDCVYDGDGNITYERSKVRDRRADNARIVIRIHPCLKPLIERYKAGRLDQHKVFRFFRRYSNHCTFISSIDQGLKEVGKLAGIPGLNFYAARHSMATIATNDLGINKYVVHEMLNHRLHLFRVTNRYLRQNFDEINNANFKLLDRVFGGHEEEGTHNTFIDPDGEFGSSVFIDALEEVVEDCPVTFSYMVRPQDKLQNDTWRVILRVAYRGEDVDIPTSIIVDKNDMNRNFEIMDTDIIDRCEALAEICRDKISDINFGTIDNIQDILAILRD